MPEQVVEDLEIVKQEMQDSSIGYYQIYVLRGYRFDYIFSSCKLVLSKVPNSVGSNKEEQ